MAMVLVLEVCGGARTLRTIETETEPETSPRPVEEPAFESDAEVLEYDDRLARLTERLGAFAVRACTIRHRTGGRKPRNRQSDRRRQAA